MAEEHKGLPVQGYRAQPESNIQLVNENKIAEEKILRTLDTSDFANETPKTGGSVA